MSGTAKSGRKAGPREPIEGRNGWQHKSGTKEGSTFMFHKEIAKANRDFYRRRYGCAPPPVSRSELGVCVLMPRGAMRV